MPYSESARDRKIRSRLEAWTVQQFGQSADYSAWDGAAACTHVCIQKLYYIWTGKKISIDYISKLAGYNRERNSAGQPRGFNAAEVGRVMDKLNLPYVVKFHMPWDDLWVKINAAPILYAVRYGSEPDWRGYRYMGKTADGQPNGFARKNGRTQLSGFENGPHMVLMGYKRTVTNSSGDYLRTELVRHDPNHGSASRPERPPYDVISGTQGKTEYNDYSKRLGRPLMAWLPTKTLPA